MKATARIISTYSADVFGVCSALFELGGMCVMHDASGCNSTYSTHDEPRWYDMDSMVYISGLSEMEAILGDDEKLISDLCDAAARLHPRFIAIAGTPIPMMTGFDYDAVAQIVEERTGIPTLGFATTGMKSYISGASMAFERLAQRLVLPCEGPAASRTVNILGLTPLDFSVNGADAAIAAFLRREGFSVLSRWAMGSTLEELAQAGRASVNLVVSAAGLGAAKALQARFGTPYVVGLPMGRRASRLVADALEHAIASGESQICSSELRGNIAIVGEGVSSLALATALALEAGLGATVLCATDCDPSLLRSFDRMTPDEDDLIEALRGAGCMIADPLYRPICPEGVGFISLPTEAFSGRMFRDEIPNLITQFDKFLKEVLSNEMVDQNACAHAGGFAASRRVCRAPGPDRRDAYRR